MFTVDELSRKIAEYENGRMSLQDFQNWFEDNSNGAYAVPGLRELFAAVEAAFSEYYYDDVGQDALKAGLANAIRPFARRPLTRVLQWSESQGPNSDTREAKLSAAQTTIEWKEKPSGFARGTVTVPAAAQMALHLSA